MADLADNSLLNLIGRTYDAALDERLWSGLAPEIAKTFNSSSASLRLRNFRTGYAPLLTATANYSLDKLEGYAAYYWRHDKWANRATKLGMSRIFTSKELISDDELERSEWYQDWLQKLNIYYVVGCVFPTGTDEICSLGIHRERASGAYLGRDKRPVSQYLPHLKRAVTIRQKVAAASIERAATLDALERAKISVVVVSQEGRIFYANSKAVQLFKVGNGIRTSGGRIATSDRRATERLLALIHKVTETASSRGLSAGGAIAVQRGEARLPLTALVAPFPPAKDGLGWAVPAAIVFVRDPEQLEPSALALKDMFGLTAAEAAIASAAARGLSIEAYAAALGISLNTARTQIKNALMKTGTRRQAELVSLLLRGAATLSRK